MRGRYNCRYCGFSTNKTEQYARHFGVFLTCRQKLYSDIAKALQSEKRIADIASEVGVHKTTVYSVSKGPVAPSDAPARPTFYPDVGKLLASLPPDLSIAPLVNQSIKLLVRTGGLAKKELERLEGELASSKREISALRAEVSELRRAKAKAEEERDRILRIHNELVTSGKIKGEIREMVRWTKVHVIIRWTLA